ncbi:MAG: ATP-binding protein [Chloroflexota bacterium]
MNQVKPLPPTTLYRRCDPTQFPFASTADLPSQQEMLGQERAVQAIQFGIGMHHEGFNLFVLGASGTGKFTAVSQFLTQTAVSEPLPSDWCYVYNFDQPHKPNALQMGSGQAGPFSQRMKQLVNTLFNVIPAAFSSDEYQSRRKGIEQSVRDREKQALEELKEQATAQGITLLQTPAGFAFAPLQDGKVISPDAFMRLPTDEQSAIEQKVTQLQEALSQIMQQLPQWQREIQQRTRQLNEEVAAYAVAPLFNELRQAYRDLAEVVAYLDAVQHNVVDSVEAILNAENPQPGNASVQEVLERRYTVNVMVDHSQNHGAPVVYEEQPRFHTLLGRIEHISQMGTLLTDFTLIKPGLLHQANGGYLILDARKLLLQPYAWEGLKLALRNQEIRIESLGQMVSLISTVSLEPEPIPLDVKVILLGERLLYYLLCAYDPDFEELFKVAADFEDDMPRNRGNNMAYAHLIGELARKEGLRHFDKTAVSRVIEHASRLAGDSEKLTTHMQTVTDLLREADYWAGKGARELVTAEDVQQALDAQTHRAGRLRERLQEAILRNTILIDTDGEQVGQINGLAVYALGQQTFGKPSRITARVRLGKGEVIDIERQVEMGGAIHSKGVLILSGFLGARYAAERPFPLSATLVFEQSYGGVDGDSASAAELFTLLSALAQVPIKQSFAVTGSVNQHGQIQAIGGVNEKIEGFFELCQARGLTGEQGVLIPASNVAHLMLRQDVVNAVDMGKFHIYPIQTIDEGIELLTGMEAGEVGENGRYSPNTINGRVVARLEAWARQQQAFANPVRENGSASTVVKQ